MEKALYDTALFREFVRLDAGEDNLPDKSTILRFRHLLKAHNLSLQILATVNATLAAKGLLLKSGTVVDVTLIAAPSSTKNSSGERDPEMHQTKKGNQWHFGMKCPHWCRCGLGPGAHGGGHGCQLQRLYAGACSGARRGNRCACRHGLPRRGQTSGDPASTSTGRWLCVRASARRWTRVRRWARSWISWSGPRLNTRSGSSSAGSGM